MSTTLKTSVSDYARIYQSEFLSDNMNIENDKDIVSKFSIFDSLNTDKTQKLSIQNKSTSFLSQSRNEPNILLMPNYFPKIKRDFILINKWEGVVESIENSDFHAILSDLTHGGAKEEITFSIEDVSEDDKYLLKEGAVFYWSIGYSITNGVRRKSSEIRFKRLPNWTERETDKALDFVNQMKEQLQWD